MSGIKRKENGALRILSGLEVAVQHDTKDLSITLPKIDSQGWNLVDNTSFYLIDVASANYTSDLFKTGVHWAAKYAAMKVARFLKLVGSTDAADAQTVDGAQTAVMESGLLIDVYKSTPSLECKTPVSMQQNKWTSFVRSVDIDPKLREAVTDKYRVASQRYESLFRSQMAPDLDKFDADLDEAQEAYAAALLKSSVFEFLSSSYAREGGPLSPEHAEFIASPLFRANSDDSAKYISDVISKVGPATDALKSVEFLRDKSIVRLAITPMLIMRMLIVCFSHAQSIGAVSKYRINSRIESSLLGAISKREDAIQQIQLCKSKILAVAEKIRVIYDCPAEIQMAVREDIFKNKTPFHSDFYRNLISGGTFTVTLKLPDDASDCPRKRLSTSQKTELERFYRTQFKALYEMLIDVGIVTTGVPIDFSNVPTATFYCSETHIMQRAFVAGCKDMNFYQKMKFLSHVASNSSNFFGIDPSYNSGVITMMQSRLLIQEFVTIVTSILDDYDGLYLRHRDLTNRSAIVNTELYEKNRGDLISFDFVSKLLSNLNMSWIDVISGDHASFSAYIESSLACKLNAVCTRTDGSLGEARDVIRRIVTTLTRESFNFDNPNEQRRQMFSNEFDLTEIVASQTLLHDFRRCNALAKRIHGLLKTSIDTMINLTNYNEIEEYSENPQIVNTNHLRELHTGTPVLLREFQLQQLRDTLEHFAHLIGTSKLARRYETWVRNIRESDRVFDETARQWYKTYTFGYILPRLFAHANRIRDSTSYEVRHRDRERSEESGDENSYALNIADFFAEWKELALALPSDTEQKYDGVADFREIIKSTDDDENCEDILSISVDEFIAEVRTIFAKKIDDGRKNDAYETICSRFSHMYKTMRANEERAENLRQRLTDDRAIDELSRIERVDAHMKQLCMAAIDVFMGKFVIPPRNVAIDAKTTVEDLQARLMADIRDQEFSFTFRLALSCIHLITECYKIRRSQPFGYSTIYATQLKSNSQCQLWVTYSLNCFTVDANLTTYRPYYYGVTAGDLARSFDMIAKTVLTTNLAAQEISVEKRCLQVFNRIMRAGTETGNPRRFDEAAPKKKFYLLNGMTNTGKTTTAQLIGVMARKIKMVPSVLDESECHLEIVIVCGSLMLAQQIFNDLHDLKLNGDAQVVTDLIFGDTRMTNFNRTKKHTVAKKKKKVRGQVEEPEYATEVKQSWLFNMDRDVLICDAEVMLAYTQHKSNAASNSRSTISNPTAVVFYDEPNYMVGEESACTEINAATVIASTKKHAAYVPILIHLPDVICFSGTTTPSAIELETMCNAVGRIEITERPSSVINIACDCRLPGSDVDQYTTPLEFVPTCIGDNIFKHIDSTPLVKRLFGPKFTCNLKKKIENIASSELASTCKAATDADYKIKEIMRRLKKIVEMRLEKLTGDVIASTSLYWAFLVFNMIYNSFSLDGYVHTSDAYVPYNITDDVRNLFDDSVNRERSKISLARRVKWPVSNRVDPVDPDTSLQIVPLTSNVCDISSVQHTRVPKKYMTGLIGMQDSYRIPSVIVKNSYARDIEKFYMTERSKCTNQNYKPQVGIVFDSNPLDSARRMMISILQADAKKLVAAITASNVEKKRDALAKAESDLTTTSVTLAKAESDLAMKMEFSSESDGMSKYLKYVHSTMCGWKEEKDTAIASMKDVDAQNNTQRERRQRALGVAKAKQEANRGDAQDGEKADTTGNSKTERHVDDGSVGNIDSEKKFADNERKYGINKFSTLDEKTYEYIFMLKYGILMARQKKLNAGDSAVDSEYQFEHMKEETIKYLSGHSDGQSLASPVRIIMTFFDSFGAYGLNIANATTLFMSDRFAMTCSVETILQALSRIGRTGLSAFALATIGPYAMVRIAVYVSQGGNGTQTLNYIRIYEILRGQHDELLKRLPVIAAATKAAEAAKVGADVDAAVDVAVHADIRSFYARQFAIYATRRTVANVDLLQDLFIIDSLFHAYRIAQCDSMFPVDLVDELSNFAPTVGFEAYLRAAALKGARTNEATNSSNYFDIIRRIKDGSSETYVKLIISQASARVNSANFDTAPVKISSANGDDVDETEFTNEILIRRALGMA